MERVISKRIILLFILASLNFSYLKIPGKNYGNVYTKTSVLFISVRRLFSAAKPYQKLLSNGNNCFKLKNSGKACDQSSGSFVVSPHPNDFHNAAFFENLVHKPMLDIDPSRGGATQISYKLLIGRGSLKRICFKYSEEFLGFWFQTSRRKFPGILLSLFRVNKRPFHQESPVEHFPTGVLRPRTIDSRILGIDSKYSVS